MILTLIGLGSRVGGASVEEGENLVLPGVDGGGEPRDLVDLNRDGPLVELDETAVGGVAFRRLVHPSQQVDRDPGGRDLVVGVLVTQPLEDLVDDVVLEALLGEQQQLAG